MGTLCCILLLARFSRMPLCPWSQSCLVFTCVIWSSSFAVQLWLSNMPSPQTSKKTIYSYSQLVINGMRLWLLSFIIYSAKPLNRINLRCSRAMLDLNKKKANILPWGKKKSKQVKQLSRGKGSVEWECRKLAEFSCVWDGKERASVLALDEAYWL